MYDVILYNHVSIHPQIKRCEWVISRQSTKYWVDFKWPPKHYIKIWQHFLTEQIEPLLSKLEISWNEETAPNYINSFYKSNLNSQLYQQLDHGFLLYMPKQTHTRDNQLCYHTTAQLVFLSQQDVQQLLPVEIDYKPKSIQCLTKKHEAPMWKKHIPPDGGAQLIQYSQHLNTPLLGASNASVKDGQCSHAWIITTPNPDHIGDPLMSIYGQGMVGGYHHSLSSARSKIQGQTAAATLLHGFNKTLNTSNIPNQLIGNNQGVQNKCNWQTGTILWSHKDPNADLFMEYHAVTSTLKLKELKLSPEATLNVWCDKQAEIACQ